jgi:hypothetical protein
MSGTVSKNFDPVNSDPPSNGVIPTSYKGIEPRSGEAKMDGGTNDYKPADTGNYKGKKGFDTLNSR